MKSSTLPILLVGVVVLACIGCSKDKLATRPPALAQPVAVTPDSAVGLFELGWNDRALDDFPGLFSADFLFVFAPGDSAGNLFRYRPVDRAELLTMLRNLFVGGGSEPPANDVHLTLGPALTVMDDPRPGKDPGWHKAVRATVDMSVRTSLYDFIIMGDALFFVVRGDSAIIPADLGVGPDAGRWYIDQWNDETYEEIVVPAPRAHATLSPPVERVSWGKLLSLYR